MKIKLTTLLAASVLFFGCNNSKTDSTSTSADSLKHTATDQTATNTTTTTSTSAATPTKISIDGKESNLGGSLLVQKDKDHLQAGDDYMVMLTAPNPAGHEALVLNFLLALKTGT